MRVAVSPQSNSEHQSTPFAAVHDLLGGSVEDQTERCAVARRQPHVRDAEVVVDDESIGRRRARGLEHESLGLREADLPAHDVARPVTTDRVEVPDPDHRAVRLEVERLLDVERDAQPIARDRLDREHAADVGRVEPSRPSELRGHQSPPAAATSAAVR
ncbi:MAG: hypothetical protein IPK74_39820 [Deltaproteobacteria bacterium]|nr:hypothetical protein [Deltaproteobacteria bacterium]